MGTGCIVFLDQTEEAALRGIVGNDLDFVEGMEFFFNPGTMQELKRIDVFHRDCLNAAADVGTQLHMEVDDGF